MISSLISFPYLKVSFSGFIFKYVLYLYTYIYNDSLISKQTLFVGADNFSV